MRARLIAPLCIAVALFEFLAAAAIARVVAAYFGRLAPVGFDVMMRVMIVLAVGAVHVALLLILVLVLVLVVRRRVVRRRFVFGHKLYRCVRWSAILHGRAIIMLDNSYSAGRFTSLSCCMR